MGSNCIISNKPFLHYNQSHYYTTSAHHKAQILLLQDCNEYSLIFGLLSSRYSIQLDDFLLATIEIYFPLSYTAYVYA